MKKRKYISYNDYSAHPVERVANSITVYRRHGFKILTIKNRTDIFHWLF
ncbi:hypothetical protein PEB0122_010130 [Bartonella apis]|nr:hypothetical protein PEB0150_017430 [Bartonella apis]OLY47896.1 hypothetical protein PEB0122_010130 [Bartonella apis]